MCVVGEFRSAAERGAPRPGDPADATAGRAPDL
jgi:hypothetical protein